MKEHPIKNAEELLCKIQENMFQKKPVLMYIKYNALYYNKFYKDKTFTSKHMILFDKWNSNTGIYTVRDSAFLREANVFDVDAEYLFPVCFQEEQIKKLWQDSCQGNDAELMHSIYTIEFCGDNFISYFELLKKMIMRGYKNSQFAKYIAIYEKRPKEYWIFDKTAFVGSIKGIYHILERYGKKEAITLSAWDELLAYKEEYIKLRDSSFGKLYKMMLHNEKMRKQERQQLILENEHADEKFFRLTEKFLEAYEQYEKSCQIRIVDISHLYNNEAIAPEAKMSCTADIAGTGLFFVFPENEEPENTRFFLSKKTADGVKDNICCNGQEIIFPCNNYKKMVLLACAEYGNYTEKIQFYNGEKHAFNITISVSDFFSNPRYGEEKVYTGETYYKKNHILEKQDFSAQIFKYNILLEQKRVSKIILPVRKNIHIFGMYFVL